MPILTDIPTRDGDFHRDWHPSFGEGSHSRFCVGYHNTQVPFRLLRLLALAKTYWLTSSSVSKTSLEDSKFMSRFRRMQE
jgi:hypothetical protein